tara:strand:+ start:203 stop:616 length:414 start_codon:yes stop_codon:yes gene_type:complete
MSLPQEMTLPLKKRQRSTPDEPEHPFVKRRRFTANVEADIRLTHLKHRNKHHFENIASYQEEWLQYRNGRDSIPTTLRNKMKESLKQWRKSYRHVQQEKEKNECVYLLCCLRKKSIYNQQDVIYNILKMISKAPIMY